MKDRRFPSTGRAINFGKPPTRQTSKKFIQSGNAGRDDRRGGGLAQTEGRRDASSESGLDVKTQRSGG